MWDQIFPRPLSDLGRLLESGVYLYRLEAGGRSLSRKVVRVR